MGAGQIALCAPDAATLRELCDSERPLVAGVANYALSYVAESANDPDGALRAARRMLDRLGDAGGPWMRALAHARIGELCLQVEPGQEAFRHLEAALTIMEELGAWPSVARARWALVLANLQRGALDEAEQGLDQLSEGTDDRGGRLDDVRRLRPGRDPARPRRRRRRPAPVAASRRPAVGHERLMDVLEVQAVAVVAHAGHGRLDQVRDIADRLPTTVHCSARRPRPTSRSAAPCCRPWPWSSSIAGTPPRAYG